LYCTIGKELEIAFSESLFGLSGSILGFDDNFSSEAKGQVKGPLPEFGQKKKQSPAFCQA